MAKFLSRRRTQVSLLIAAGYSDLQIARELKISPHTAKGYAESVLIKTQTFSRTAAIVSLLIEGHISMSSANVLRRGSGVAGGAFDLMSEENSTAKKRRGRSFANCDRRVSKKSRPKDFDGLSALAQVVANEEATVGDEPILVNGRPIAVIEDILRTWATSQDAHLQALFMEIAYGKALAVTGVSGRLESTDNGTQ